MPQSLEQIAAERREAAHSIFSPSGSKMWLNCSGSLIPNILAPDESSFEAAEGTVAHTMAELYRTKGKSFVKTQLGRTINQEGWDIEVDEDMLMHVRDYVDFAEAVDGDKKVEQRVDFSRLTPITHQSGTADDLNMRPGHLDVTDLKYGKGIPVYAEDNTQAQIYGLGSLFDWDFLYRFETITLRIGQPRLDYWGEVTIGRDDLMQFGGYVKERARQAWRFDAPRTPSPEACLWCKVQATCPARAAMLEAIADDTFEDYTEYSGEELAGVDGLIDDELGGEWLDYVEPASLSIPSLERILEYRKPTEKWFNAINDELLDRTLAGGVKLERFKAVESRSNRVFYSGKARLRAGLVRAGLTPSRCQQTDFIGPAEAERRLRSDAGLTAKEAKLRVDALTVNPPGKQTLAPITDRREDLGDLADVFDDYS